MYFFPGVSGPEIISLTHWLGALVTSYATMGAKDTQVRKIIDYASSLIDRPKLCFCEVIQGKELFGLYAGAPEQAWSKAADLSACINIHYAEHPYKQVLSVIPSMYPDMWAAAKGMYKLEPVVADGGELVLYAPHINEVFYVYGHLIDQIGYHVMDYFRKQWDKFKGYPLGVLAHSTHLKGLGTFDAGVEKPRIQVTLATGISKERCERINLGYRDPASIDPNTWVANNENSLLVPHAGEILYRLRGDTGSSPTDCQSY